MNLDIHPAVQEGDDMVLDEDDAADFPFQDYRARALATISQLARDLVSDDDRQTQHAGAANVFHCCARFVSFLKRRRCGEV